MDKRNFFKIKKINNVYSQILTDHPNIMDALDKQMTVYAENYRFMPKYKMGWWDGKIRFIENNNTFPNGLLSYIYNFVKSDQLNIEIDESLLQKNENFEDEFNELTSQWLVDHITPRDYQLAGALKAIKFKRGILEHATSAGKSLTIALISMYLHLSKKCKKILVLVPSVGLVEQMYSDFISYGISKDLIGMFYEKEKDTEKLITISTWQSLYPQKNMILNFDCLFCDEAHQQKANIIRSIGLNAFNAEYRFGTTGTISDLPKSQRWLIEGVLGPIIHKIPPSFLIENNYASDVNIKVLFLKHKEENIKKLKGMPFEDEKNWVESFRPRNKIIEKIVKKHHDVDQNVLILFDHLEHGELIKEDLKKLELTGSKIFFVTGATSGKEREQIRKFTNENKKVVIIGTYGVFSTGVSINRLHSIIFAVSGKSTVRVMQSIGRGMRLHEEKNGVKVYDICDSFHYSEKHLEERINIYDKAGYKIDVMEIDLKV